jgi:NAD(P)H-hydrate epimerase
MVKSFITDSGISVPAITSEEMREVDRIAMEETGPNLFQMMENAGRNLALTAISLMEKQWQTARYVIFAGTGGNGGGGICAARHLANHDLNVQLCITNPEKLGEVPSYQRHIFKSTAGREILLANLKNRSVDIIIDAIIGYSLRDAPEGIALEFICMANELSVPILALDVPSGIDSTSGDAPGEHIHATETMTLALPKTGLLPDKTGRLYLADIGIPEAVYIKINLDYCNPFDTRFRVPISPK